MSNQSIETPKKIGRFKRSLELTKSSWQVLKLEKNFVAIPVIGALLAILMMIMSTIIVGGVLLGISFMGGQEFALSYNPDTDSFPLWMLIPLGVIILITTFVGSLIYGAIVYGAIERFKGNNPTLKSCFEAAYSKKKPLFMFSLLSATIGLILSWIEDRVPLAGQIAVRLTGAAWSFASMFAVPFIMTSKEDLGPIASAKESVKLIKRVWGESIIISAGIGLVGFITALSYSLLVFGISLVAGVFAQPLFFVGLAVGVIGLIALSLVLSVLSNIAQSAIFYWATTGNAPKSFDKEILQSTMTPKKARKVFA